MATYKLTAKHYTPEFGVERHVKTIHADDTTDATFAAIRYIMDTAMTEPAWAKGQITLASNDGTIIHEMDAKQ